MWETLSYAAALRLPRSMGKEQRAERVQSVISALGLNKCVDTIIGGFFRRGISGGERKRVSIGHELLINPALMLLVSSLLSVHSLYCDIFLLHEQNVISLQGVKYDSRSTTQFFSTSLTLSAAAVAVVAAVITTGRAHQWA